MGADHLECFQRMEQLDDLQENEAGGGSLKNLLILSILALSACADIDYSGEGNDVPTQGEIKAGIDQADSMLMVEWMSLFTIDYPKAVITAEYGCEVNLLRQLKDNELSFVVMNRRLSGAEVEDLERNDKKVRMVHAAKTSIAIVVHPENKNDKITQKELREILTGVKVNSAWSAMNVIFDQGCGSNYKYMQDSFLNGQKITGAVFGKKSPHEVLDFVCRNKNAIGFIGLNWIADRTDSLSRQLVKKVKVIAVENPLKNGFFLPFQSQIAAKEYPFIQDIFMYDFQGYTGLAQGFISWACSQPGQILVKKSGLIPAHDMGRTIHLTDEE